MIARLLGVLLALLPALTLAQPVAGERVALVIGNAAYASSPLANPKNDAVAMSDLLTQAGFQVDRQLDTSQQQLKAAVDRFGSLIRDPKVKFAMFYYAGHGVQLEWRNYLIPVNARVRNAQDVRQQTVDVSDLLRHMELNKGKSFLVILDACRDDPFAGSYRPSAHGLSQFDAPVGSLLAYSTAPGRVALDGQGNNGLYTSHLLREFAVRGTRLEDAFKRVRLNVRLASKGQQIPWESTSLEEDVYLFPVAKKKLSDAEQDQLLGQEINRWLQIKASNDTADLVNFLRDYPSGSTSELAQARLNRLLAADTSSENAKLVRTAPSAAQVAKELQDLQAVHAAAREAAERAEARRAALAKDLEKQLHDAIREAKRVEAEQQAAMKLAAEQAAAAQRAQAQAQAQAQAAALQQAQADAAREQQAQALAARQRAEAEIAQAQAREAKLQAELAEQNRVAALQREAARAEAQRMEATRLALQKQQADMAAQPASTGTGVAASNAVQVASVDAGFVLASTPYFKGYAEHERRYTVGDQYQFRIIDGFNKSSKPLDLQVSLVDTRQDRVEFNQGEYVSDLMGNVVRNARGGMDTPRQFYPAELFVGKKWHTRFKQSRPNGVVYNFYYDLKVVAKETVTVPAGTFETFRIEARGYNVTLGARLERNIWVAPGVAADIAHETLVRLRSGGIDQNDRQELVAYKAGSRAAGK